MEACPVMGEQLTTEQKEELAGVLKEFAGVFSDLPGRTSLVEHPIECGSARPIRLAPYRIPHAYRKAVQQEISEMLEGGVIEPSITSSVVFSHGDCQEKGRSPENLCGLQKAEQCVAG